MAHVGPVVGRVIHVTVTLTLMHVLTLSEFDADCKETRVRQVRVTLSHESGDSVESLNLRVSVVVVHVNRGSIFGDGGLDGCDYLHVYRLAYPADTNKRVST
jgi:hypothetical protein